MKEEKPVVLTEMLELMHRETVDKNATTISIKGHKCRNLDGYCYTVTVCAQDDCEDCNDQ